MAAAAETVRVPAPHDTVAARVLRALAKTPLQILLVVIGLLWLVPTIGLFITSILPGTETATAGWWKIFAHPSLATFSNYSALFHNSGLTGALKTTAYVAVGNTLLVVIVGALAGIESGGMPVSPRSATCPGCSGVFRVKPFDVVPVIAADDGCASWIGPEETNADRTPPIVALIAPWLGSLRYMTCQITPVAKSEIAIGMKTTVLNATAQRTRSVRTAKMRPRAVMIAGTIATQIALFSIDLRMTSFSKSAL
jgi:hypothetical protein